MMVRAGINCLNLILFTFVIVLGVDLFYRWLFQVPFDASWQQRMDSAADMRSGLAPAYARYRTIAARNLFAVDSKSAPGPPRPRPVAQPASQPIQLHGTVVGNQGALYAVMTQQAGGAQKLLRPGDTIGDARVVSVQREQVVILRDGQRQNIGLTGPDPNRSSVADVTPAQNRPVQNASIDAAAIKETLANGEEMLRQNQIIAFFRNGRPEGLQFRTVKEDSLWDRLGLQADDVLLEINKHRLTSMAEAAKQLGELKPTQEVRLKVLRDDRVIIIRHKF